MKNTILTLAILFISCINTVCDSQPPQPPLFLNFLYDPWVDAQIGRMSTEEQIAQLMMLDVYPVQDEDSRLKVEEQIRNLTPGGILVMQGAPVKTARWINSFQEQANTPLLVAIDGEWGPAMRIDSTVEYPYAQAVGAVQDTATVYRMGTDFGQQLKMMGIHINFAPVADVNTNPANPVINFRSFGESPVNVADKAWFTAKGMQDAGVVPVVKHFPGHGDTRSDSHQTLPTLTHTKARLDSVETLPFRLLSQKGIAGIMTAHLNIPAIDGEDTIPSSLSKKVVTGYLKTDIGFSGLTVTDALNMQGVVQADGSTELRAILAGNDLLTFVSDLGKAVASIMQAVERGEITAEDIEARCRKILAVKRWANLHEYRPVDLTNLTENLNSPRYEVTVRSLIRESLTVLRNEGGILPVGNLGERRIASVAIGAELDNPFQTMLGNYAPVDNFAISKTASESELTNLLARLKDYDLIILGIYGITNYPSSGRNTLYGTTPIQRRTISEIIKQNTTVTVVFGNAYALEHLDDVHLSEGLVVAYQNLRLTQELAAQAVFGAFDLSGRLPVSAGTHFNAGDGLAVGRSRILEYAIAEEVGIDSKIITQKIDSLVALGITAGAYPGCQVLVAKDGKVFFHKSYGYQTYDSRVPVAAGNLYDLASLTKIIGPLPALMKLTDDRIIDPDHRFSRYWPAFQHTDKEKITLREVLAHQAQLPASINMWRMALNQDKTLSAEIFRPSPSGAFSVQVANSLYMNSSFLTAMYDTISNAKLRPQKRYEYSDLGFMLFPEIISRLTGQSYEAYLNTAFFRPMGASSIIHNPYKTHQIENIIPTEQDNDFRKQTIRGFVHDENAAMMGGVSGSAGLFATANDLAKVLQMYIQKGFYGGRRYISEKTVDEYTSVQFPRNNNRRALGFDKPYLDNSGRNLRTTYPAPDASPDSFGHTGFTGTMAWADPESNLVFIFLSNRINPSRENTKLSDLNIRSAILQTVYDSVTEK